MLVTPLKNRNASEKYSLGYITQYKAFHWNTYLAAFCFVHLDTTFFGLTKSTVQVRYLGPSSQSHIAPQSQNLVFEKRKTEDKVLVVTTMVLTSR